MLEIETNQFQQIQKIVEKTVFDESAFGQAVGICPNNCSVYIGAPLEGGLIPQVGLVQRQVNQSRIYGVTTSTVANPILTPGDTIRINDSLVTVPNTTIQSLITAINTSGIPNVAATATPDVTLYGDGSTKIFDIGNIYSAASAYTSIVYLDDVLQIANPTGGYTYTYTNATQQISFVTAPVMGSVIKVISGRMTVSVINAAAATEYAKLTVLPGVSGTAFADIGFTTYAYTQTIVSPNPTPYAQFGTALSINSNAVNLVVGAPNGNVYEPTTFDAGQTYFDEHSTTFFNQVDNSGVAYTFDYLPSSSDSLSNPGQFVFGQQIYNNNLETNDLFGFAVNYRNNRLVVGSPGQEADEDYDIDYDVTVFDNPNGVPSWTVIYEQQPAVDIELINSVYSFDKLLNSTQTYFDFIDPLQGKILGVARRNIDYIGAVDPANYNAGSVHNIGTSWGAAHVGEIWWSTYTVRFIEPNQGDITYASRRWAQTFPGSSIDIYQWVESSVPPASYTGPGTPFSTISYTVTSSLNNSGVFVTNYYFWVTGLATIDTTAGKTLSTNGIAGYILNPLSSGLPYIAPLSANTVALYNAKGLLSASDTILHVEYSRQADGSTGDIHTEYAFIADGRPDSFLNANLYRKLLDSFSGQDTVGNLVPDPLLSLGLQYGVEFRPRQSMFADRFTALQNYLGRANTILAQYPISETRSFNLLNSSEPTPAANSGAWDYAVPNLEILYYQNLAIVPLGYLYLVESDSSQNGRWTIYVVAQGFVPGTRVLNLVQVQTYDTPLYWNYINWYLPGYNSSVQPLVTVANTAGLQALSISQVPIGSSVKVTANGQGKYEIYLRTGISSVTGWQRVGLQDGTIEFKEELWNYSVGKFGFDVQVFDAQYFDQYPAIETRQIIRAINEELFIDDLLIERNQSLILMFKFIYSEFNSPYWLMKTSYIEVDHVIRGLEPFQLYQPDNQTFVLDYLQEVKPYHVQNLSFNLIYDGIDTWPGLPTDYDVPAYWNSTLEIPQFVSPVLTPYTLSSSLVESTVSDAAATAQVWLEQPWSAWFNNYLLEIQGVEVANGGSGYTIPPSVTVTGTCVTPAEMTAVINSAGRVVAVNIINPGSGYSTTATITFTGGNGSGAVAVAQMGNNLVRSIKTTIKYDRYQYASTIIDWEPNVTYTEGTQVRWLNRGVWSANSTVSGPVFIPDEWTRVVADTLSGVDRTMGLYVPGPNMPGLSLPLLIDGVEYPGVQVTAPTYSQNSGFDVGNFDINPFDNFAIDEVGRPTYSPTILDARYSSAYLDPYLGTRATDINVDGGKYIDVFSSYAPEELIPGSEFDTLDMRVYTRPGADWLQRGHGFPEATYKFIFDSLNPTVSFANIQPYPVQITVSNQTQQTALTLDYGYTVDWANQTITVIANANAGDVIVITVFELGGGNQLYKQVYNGADVVDTITVPVTYSEIQEFAIFVNGVVLVENTDYTYQSILDSNQTQINFVSTYTSTDFISLVAIGPTTVNSTTINYSWSAPQTQVIIGNGTLSFTLNNSLIYNNPDSIVVSVNGTRARTAAGVNWVGDDITVEYSLPSRLGFSESLIADNQVHVYVNNIPQILGVDFTVTPYSAGVRTVLFETIPTAGQQILIYVLTNTQCYVNGDQLVFNSTGGLVPTVGALIDITTWNDPRQQNILTQCFVGPITEGITVTEGYDTTDFDVGPVTGDPGSFDYSAGGTTTINNIDLGTVINDPSRLLVSLNGRQLFYGINFTIDGTQLMLTSGLLNATDVLMVTQFTNFVVPEAMAFRIFQDMRGVQATYRITPETTTTTTQPVLITDDTIYVTNAGALVDPDLAANIWGVLTIGAERIMYRYRDTVANTVSGLSRGTAGTALAPHTSGATVYNMGRGNLLPAEYQNYIVSDTTLADGSTTVFTATDITITDNDAIEVYVGGILVVSGYTVTADSPVTILFTTAPVAGVDVTILINRGVTWYAPGAGTPSNGNPLQETETIAARFLRGL